MSRIGKKPVIIPDKVTVLAKSGSLLVKGPLGELDISIPQGINVLINNSEAVVETPPKTRGNRGYQGLVRSLLANMVKGVTQGYERSLEINGVGYKCEKKSDLLTFSLGYSHTIDLKLPKGLTADVNKQQTKVTIKGIDKQLVGQIAAQIRSFKEPEPYKGKGVKYLDETIKRKVGKAGSK